jgi:tetratricopeptide (TPR) repeat protein
MNRDAIARHQLGVELQQAGSLREAADAYEEALAIDPRLELARSNLAMVLYQLGEIDQAIFHLRTLLETQGLNVKARFNLGGIYAAIGRDDQAIDEYRQVLALEGGHAMALHNLARIFQRQKRYGEAIATYERLLELNPEDTQVLFQLGNLQRMAGDLAQAETYWRTVTTVDPRHVGALLAMAELGRLREDWDEVLRWALDVLMVEPENVPALVMSSKAHMQLLEYQQAAEILYTLAEKHPQLAEVRYHLGALYHTVGQVAEARVHLEEAVRLDGNHHFEYHNELGSVLYRLGELEAAAEQFRTAEELAPDNAVVKANLGFCYMGLGDRASAGAYFEAFMARPAADASIRLSVQCALDLL